MLSKLPQCLIIPNMSKLINAIDSTTCIDKTFIGTIAFKSEDIELPNGSTMALGIDCGRWVLIYQNEKGDSFVVYEYDSTNNSLLIDKKAGDKHDFIKMKEHINYFFTHAYTDDLVTIVPSGGENA